MVKFNKMKAKIIKFEKNSRNCQNKENIKKNCQLQKINGRFYENGEQNR